MKLFLAVFGKPGSAFTADEVSKYVTRLKNSGTPLEIIEFRESKREDKTKALQEEADEFSKKFPEKDFFRIILSEEGKLLNTIQLSQVLEKNNHRNIVFLIGSAYGIDNALKKSSGLLLSLSPLTFTHDHARVIASEQIYRCMMVLKKHPYHHV